MLPRTELEPEIGRVVVVAKEFNLPGAGFAGVLLVSEWGRLVMEACKRRLGEYLRDQPGLVFDLGLLEIADYRFADPATGEERRIVQPRLMAKTQIIDRFVIRSEVPGITIAVEDERHIAISARATSTSSESVASMAKLHCGFCCRVPL